MTYRVDAPGHPTTWWPDEASARAEARRLELSGTKLVVVWEWDPRLVGAEACEVAPETPATPVVALGSIRRLLRRNGTIQEESA